MMCKTITTVKVKIAVDLSHTGKSFWKAAAIDACVADLVQALQSANIDMRSSCCGHGKTHGSILLQDGRKLLIVQETL